MEDFNLVNMFIIIGLLFVFFYNIFKPDFFYQEFKLKDFFKYYKKENDVSYIKNIINAFNNAKTGGLKKSKKKHYIASFLLSFLFYLIVNI